MKKLFKWLFRLIILLVVLVVAAIILLPIFFDPNDHKPRIQQLAADSLGREIVLNGTIEWSVFPRLALELNDVQVANESGFKGDYLAQVKTLSAGLEWLPLLKSEIKVGEIILQQPEISLQVAQSGQSNWQSILDKPTPEPGSDTASDQHIEIKEVAIEAGQIYYKDAASGLEFNLSQVNFNSDTIKANHDTNMSLDAVIALPANNLQGQLEASWVYQQKLPGTSPTLLFDELSFDGQLNDVPLQLDSQGTNRIDLAKDQLNIAQLSLSYGALTLETPVMGQQLTDRLSLSGELTINPFTLDALLESMGSSLENEADNLMSGKMKWSFVDDRLELNGVEVKLYESMISGSVKLSSVSQMQGNFNLDINQMDLDQYLPKSHDQTDKSEQSGGQLDLGRLNGQINMSQLKAAGVSFSDISLQVKTSGENISVEPLQAGFYQGLIKTELQLRPSQPNNKLTVKHQMQDFQAGGLLRDLMAADYITGLGQLEASLTIDEPFSEVPLKSANGELNYRLTDGDIIGIDVFNIIQKSLNFLNQQEAAETNAALKTEFGLMEVSAQVQQGILKTDVLKLSSPYFNLSGDVTINLAELTIRGTIRPMLTNIPEGVLDERYQKLLGVRIPVSLKGQLLAPDIAIDIEKLILESQKAKIDEKKAELKEDLFDALLGDDDKRNKDKSDQQAETGEQAGEAEMTEKEKKKAREKQMKRDLLEGLFKSSKKDKDEENDKKDDDGNL